jgi:hypothetical protein
VHDIVPKDPTRLVRRDQRAKTLEDLGTLVLVGRKQNVIFVVGIVHTNIMHKVKQGESCQQKIVGVLHIFIQSIFFLCLCIK